MGGYSKFWEMKRGGPHDPDPDRIFKCTGCGAETLHEEGWNGEPDSSHCHEGCSCRSDWSPGRVSDAYKRNFDRIFPDAPGAGI